MSLEQTHKVMGWWEDNMKASLQKKSLLTSCSALKLTKKNQPFLNWWVCQHYKTTFFSLTSCIIEPSDSLTFVLIFVSNISTMEVNYIFFLATLNQNKIKCISLFWRIIQRPYLRWLELLSIKEIVQIKTSYNCVDWGK